MQRYSTRLNADAIYQFTGLLLEQAPRKSCLAVRVLIDLVRNQGDSPANVLERCTGDRDSTAAENMIRLLVRLGFCEVVEVSGSERVGDTARRRVYLTRYGADVLGLKPL